MIEEGTRRRKAWNGTRWKIENGKRILKDKLMLINLYVQINKVQIENHLLILNLKENRNRFENT